MALTEPNKMKALKALVNSSISNEKSDKDSLSAKRTMNNSVQVPLFILEDSSCPDILFLYEHRIFQLSLYGRKSQMNMTNLSDNWDLKCVLVLQIG